MTTRRSALCTAAALTDPRLDALVGLLVCDGLKMAEALALDIADVAGRAPTTTVTVRHRGTLERTVLDLGTFRAIRRCIGRRTAGPVFVSERSARPAPPLDSPASALITSFANCAPTLPSQSTPTPTPTHSDASAFHTAVPTARFVDAHRRRRREPSQPRPRAMMPRISAGMPANMATNGTHSLSGGPGVTKKSRSFSSWSRTVRGPKSSERHATEKAPAGASNVPIVAKSPVSTLEPCTAPRNEVLEPSENVASQLAPPTMASRATLLITPPVSTHTVNRPATSAVNSTAEAAATPDRRRDRQQPHRRTGRRKGPRPARRRSPLRPTRPRQGGRRARATTRPAGAPAMNGGGRSRIRRVRCRDWSRGEACHPIGGQQ